MEPPRGLNAEGRRAFDHAVEALTATGDDPSRYRGAVERYARAADMAATLRRGRVARGSPVVAVGSRKSPTTHPLVREIADHERHVQALAESLLLTPMARRKASRAPGLPQGASQAGPACGWRIRASDVNRLDDRTRLQTRRRRRYNRASEPPLQA